MEETDDNLEEDPRSEDLDEDEDDSRPALIEDSSYGSPGGLRRAFSLNDEDEDDTKESSPHLQDTNSPISSRARNKRKNFKPRNIVSEAVAMNLSNDPKKQLLMPKMSNDNNSSPMDLSVNNVNNDGDDEDELMEDDDDASSEPSRFNHDAMVSSASGLSVVGPEVLFGANSNMKNGPPSFPQIPPFLAPFLAASREAAPASSGPSMKDAFQEVLKLFGFPPELAEVFAKNAQAVQQQQQQLETEHQQGQQEQGKLISVKVANDASKARVLVIVWNHIFATNQQQQLLHHNGRRKKVYFCTRKCRVVDQIFNVIFANVSQHTKKLLESSNFCCCHHCGCCNQHKGNFRAPVTGLLFAINAAD